MFTDIWVQPWTRDPSEDQAAMLSGLRRAVQDSCAPSRIRSCYWKDTRPLVDTRNSRTLANQYGVSEKKLSCQLKLLKAAARNPVSFVLPLRCHSPLPLKRELAKACQPSGRSFTVHSRFLPTPAAIACVFWVRGHLTDKTDRRTGYSTCRLHGNMETVASS